MGVTTLVLCDQKISPGVYWTSDSPRKVMRFRNKLVAQETCKRYRHNNCRVVSYEEAIGIVSRQYEYIRGFNSRVGIEQDTNEVNDDEFNR